MRPLYADISPGLGWNGREPEALEVATATQVTTRTVSAFLATGVLALFAQARPLAFLVGGATPAHAPETATVTGTDEDDAVLVEVVYLPTNSAGSRVAAAVCSEGAYKTVDSVVYSAGGGTGATVAIGFGLIPGVRDVRGSIRIEYLLEALGDRSRPGMLSKLLVDELGVSASGIIDGRLGKPTGNYTTPFAIPPPHEIGRLAIEMWVAEAGKKHPQVIVVDHVSMRTDVMRELDKLHKANTNPGVPAAEPANVGGGVYPSPFLPGAKPKFLGIGKFGIY